MAPSHSPLNTKRQANSSAVSEDEHAVSTAIDGPRKSKAKDIRLANIERAQPFGNRPVSLLLYMAHSVSDMLQPTKTPIRRPRSSAGLRPASISAS